MILPSVTQSISKGLADFLKSKMPSINAAYYNFPSPTEPLNYPALSVFTKTPTFTPIDPYVIYKSGEPEVIDPDAEVPEYSKVKVRRVVGIYDFALQVDLWAAYKHERDQLYEELMRAFNLEDSGTGVNLQLSQYYDIWARLDLDEADFSDDEAASQRNEWRIRARILGNCRAIKETMESLIVLIENTLETPTFIEEPVEEESDIII